MKRYLTYLLVILNPYNDIDMEVSNLYIIEDPDTHLEIVETLGDGYLEIKTDKSQTIVLRPYYQSLSTSYSDKQDFPY